MSATSSTAANEKLTIKLTDYEMQVYHLVMHILKISPFTYRKVILSNLRVHDDGSKMVTTKALVMEDYDDTDPSQILSQLDNMMFDRLMMQDESMLSRNVQSFPVTSIAELDANADKGATERRPLHYLYQCYHRCTLVCRRSTGDENRKSLLASAQSTSTSSESSMESVLLQLKTVIINQSSLYLNVNGSDNVKDVIINLIDAYGDKTNHEQVLKLFLEQVATRMLMDSGHDNGDASLVHIFKRQLFDQLERRIADLSIVDVRLHPLLSILTLLVTSGPNSTKILMMSHFPWINDRLYFQSSKVKTHLLTDVLGTIFGRLLSISCLTRIGNLKLEFFTDAIRNVDSHQVMEDNIGAAIRRLVTEIKNIWHKIFSYKEVKDLLLDWIGIVLFALKDQTKMWTNAVAMEGGNNIMVTDSFTNNFSYVLLLFCKPFVSNPKDNKILKIDPRYVMADPLDLGRKVSTTLADQQDLIHLRNLKDETFLIPEIDQQHQLDMQSFRVNFMSEIFFMTHKSLQIGFKSCTERFTRLATDLNTIQRFYQDARLQSGAGGSDGTVDQWKQQLEKGMTQFLSMKTVLGQAEYVELMLKLHITTASWLNNLASAFKPSSPSSSSLQDAMSTFNPIDPTILMSKDYNPLLAIIPEFVMENISDTIIFIRRFKMEHNVINLDLEPLMTVILMFMGSEERVKNPHLRAKFAEVLESLMPNQSADHQMHPGQPSSMSLMSAFDFGSPLFVHHPFVTQLVPTLLRVFVSIELTGQSVAFEQKFQYRRPMYIVLKYLWHEVKDPHQERMKELAQEAEEQIDAPDAPLFLRFVNLLMNDANYLLDESLSLMKTLKEMQKKRDDVSEWSSMSEQQRAQHSASYQHQGRNARFHNVMAQDTIQTLAWLTSGVRSIFCSATLVHRIAQMLNYFLKSLVGSEKRNLKVKDMEEFEFKPADIVHDICLIYCNLSDPQSNPLAQHFVTAVATDGRSYSLGLLAAAADVLIRTAKSTNGLAVKMSDLSIQCDKVAQEAIAADINEDDIPEEFLCAILSDIMTDPVILPSGKIVDRKTIARHILSDQRDPFNQQHLTMDMVKPDPQLKARIEDFVRNYKKKE